MLVGLVVVGALAGCGATTPFPSSLKRVGTAGPVGPLLQDPGNPGRPDTHWHAALGVYDCGHWMGDESGDGIWVWPKATEAGSPARVENPDLYAGLHSHDDGVIHMEPLVASEAGANATLGLYFRYGGWRLSATGYSFLGTTVSNGDTCGTGPGTLQWEVAEWDGTDRPQTYTVLTGDPAAYKLFEYDVVVVAFLPAGTSIASIGNPPSLENLIKLTTPAPTTLPGRSA